MPDGSVHVEGHAGVQAAGRAAQPRPDGGVEGLDAGSNLITLEFITYTLSIIRSYLAPPAASALI